MNKNYEVVEICQYCGKPKTYFDKENNIYIGVDHKICFKIAKFEKLSIFDKNAKLNTFENAKLENEKEKKYFELFKKYCNNFEKAKEKGVGLLFSGNAGTGKTYYSNAIANELKKNKHTVLSFNLVGYLQEIRQGFDEKENELIQAVKGADLIIIDDVGNEVLTDWGKEKMFNLFNTIYLEKKCAIITTNLNGKELKEHFEIMGSDKILDRILELCKPFVFDWNSKRKKIGEENFKDIF